MENMNKNIAYEHIDFSEITKVRFCTLVEKCNYIPNHWHQSIEFIYLIKGERLATIENKSFLLHDGDCVLVNANAIHSMKLALRRCFLQFYKSVLFRQIFFAEKFYTVLNHCLIIVC